MKKRNQIIYWTSTTLLGLGMLSGGLAQLFRVNSVEDIVRLGYPTYFLSVLGLWKILGVIAILLPRFPLLKEWAYAGFFFAMTGATISHISVGDGFAKYVPSLAFALFIIVSWYFRPASRRMVQRAA